METQIILSGEYDSEEAADIAISDKASEYTYMTAENGQTIVDVDSESAMLAVTKEFLAEIGKWVVRMLLVFLGVPYPLVP